MKMALFGVRSLVLMYLNSHTYFSLRYGTLSPATLVDQARRLGLKRLALTDINNVSCASEFVSRCLESDISPVVGIEFRIADQLQVIGLARSAEGFMKLNACLTSMPERLADIRRYLGEDSEVWLIYPPDQLPLQLLGHEYCGILPAQRHLIGHGVAEDKCVIRAPITYLPEDRLLHEILTCIDGSLLLSKRPSPQTPEGFWQPQMLRKLFQRFPKVIRQTDRLLDLCDNPLPHKDDRNRQAFGASAVADMVRLEQLARDGRWAKYGERHDASEQRMLTELQVIGQCGMATYFLISHDIISFARRQQIAHVGRGSGANSIVAYCLGITNVEPLGLGLLFERFLSPERIVPPDFDLDFSWQHRDHILQHIFSHYPDQHVALLGTYQRFKGRSIVREVGKVFGLNRKELETIIQHPLADHLHHPLAHDVFAIGRKLAGLPNYLSVHCGGVLIAQDPLTSTTALKQMPKGFPITHFDMHHAELLGYHKFDVLSQRALGYIEDATQTIKEQCGVTIPIDDDVVIHNDPLVSELLKSGEVIGSFYIESPAMRGLLQKAPCGTYAQLVEVSSIIRPGVAKSGMMKTYLRRANGKEQTSYLHPVFAEHLRETYGIMIFQEDVMKIAQSYAGMSLQDGEMLRRLMTGKEKSSEVLARLQHKFFQGALRLGRAASTSAEVWRQIKSFSGYAFCKAHSASYARESMQSLYLKAHYPHAFIEAVINNGGGFYRLEIYLHEARCMGLHVRPACVNRSLVLACVCGEDLYLGLRHIKGLALMTVECILQQREEFGPYKDLPDLMRRVPLTPHALYVLLRAGALAQLGDRQVLITKAYFSWQAAPAVGQKVLFEQSVAAPLLLDDQSLSDIYQDQYDAYGYLLCDVFDLVPHRDRYPLRARDLARYANQPVKILGYFVIKKPVTTCDGMHMNYVTWYDQAGVFFDTVHLPDSLEQYPMVGIGIYLLEGKVKMDFGVATIKVCKMRGKTLEELISLQ